MSPIETIIVLCCLGLGYGLVTWALSLKKDKPLEDDDQLFFNASTPEPSTTPWWQVLDLPRDASLEQIETAYATQLSQYQLTSAEGTGSALLALAHEKTQQIEAAYRAALSARAQSS